MGTGRPCPVEFEEYEIDRIVFGTGLDDPDGMIAGARGFDPDTEWDDSMTVCGAILKKLTHAAKGPLRHHGDTTKTGFLHPVSR